MARKKAHRRAEKPNTDRRSAIPSVSELLEAPRTRDLIDRLSRPVVVEALRRTLDRMRATAKRGERVPDTSEILDAAERDLAKSQIDRLRPVVNATGIILHTGLGRAVLPGVAAEALARLDRCVNLQIDLETGKRGKRMATTEELLCRLTGAEAAMVVTNNAAATLLILTALAKDREVVISRGQLIEIGGSFRLPDCIHQSGATMVAVGTTNKTHRHDYERALTENTAVILRCNPSNYRIVGFSKAVPIGELVELARGRPIVVVDDLGCGALVRLSDFGLPDEPTVPDSIAAGADLACFSGDKLIGGPQAGIIVGRSDLIDHLKKHPLSRMLRVGKLTDMALEQTLRLFLQPERLRTEHPTLRMLSAPAEEVRKRAVRLRNRLARQGVAVEARVEPCESATGGGSLPATPIPSYALALSAPAMSADELSAQLRRAEPPVVARIDTDRVLLDLRTVLDGEDRAIADALAQILGTE